MIDQSAHAMTSKRILFISALGFWSMGEGRGAPSLHRTLMAYVDSGWDVVFVTGAGGQAEQHAREQPNLRTVSFSSGFLGSLLRLPRIGFVGRAVWWAWFWMRALLAALHLQREGRFDLVYGYETLGVPVGRFLATLWHVPFVARFQGTNLLVFWAEKRLWRLRAWEHVIALRTRADLVIMTDDGTLGDEALSLAGSDRSHVRFWVNGTDKAALAAIEPSSAARAALRLPSGPILLALSRLDTWKRLDRAIEAMPQILASQPDALLVIVGDGAERSRLETLAQRIGVCSSVRFEGSVPHTKVPEYLAAADIFLSLYDWSNVGNPLLEAMTAGKCVITLANGTTTRLVRHLENGVLLRPSDDVPSEVAKWVLKLLAHPELLAQLAAGARSFAAEYLWSWDERMAAELAEVNRLLDAAK